jgi:hypothetical protein
MNWRVCMCPQCHLPLCVAKTDKDEVAALCRGCGQYYDPAVMEIYILEYREWFGTA